MCFFEKSAFMDKWKQEIKKVNENQKTNKVKEKQVKLGNR